MIVARYPLGTLRDRNDNRKKSLKSNKMRKNKFSFRYLVNTTSTQ